MFKILPLFLLFLFTPNSSHAYVDPNIFTIIWQSLAAFLFSIIAYSKFLINYLKNYFKHLKTFYHKVKSLYLIEILILIFVILLPIQAVLSKENNFFYYQDILETIIFQFFIIIFIFFFIQIYLKNINKSIVISCTIFLFLQLYGFLEGLIITKFISAFELKNFRIISLIIFLLLNIIFIFRIKNMRIKSFKNFFVTFIIFLNLILFVNYLFNFKKEFNIDQFWAYDEPEIGMITNKQNINLIITDSYVSNEYYKKLYNKKNKFFDVLKENDFTIFSNSLSNYSNTYLSIPSIFNSNYFKKVNMELIKNTSNLIDDSYLINKVILNKYSYYYYKCQLEYLKKNRSCKKYFKYSKLRNDINMMETIYYYNSIYSAIRYIKKFINLSTNLKIFKENINTISYDIEKIFKNSSQNTLNTIVLTIPHAPYIVEENCKWKKDLSREDLTLNSNFIKDSNKRLNGYYDNINCANKYLTEFIMQIQKYDNQSITVIISDNGPMLSPKNLFLDGDTNLSEMDRYALDRNSSIIAISGNFKCKNQLNDVNFANLFRIIFNCNSIIQNELIPKKIFISEPNSLLKYNLYSKNE